MRRRLALGLLAVLTLGGLLTGLPQTASQAGVPAPPVARAAAADLDAPPSALDWQPCEGNFECATILVPLDYDQPGLGSARLAMIRYRSADQADRIGSLFLNPGGPGGSGVDFLRTAPQVALDAFTGLDLVSWDPRGIGRSTPAVDCSTDAQDDASFGYQFTTPQTAHRGRLVRQARRGVRQCLRLSDPGALRYLSTANTARDLDRMRAAVGDPKLNYVGISHGTHIGAAYSSLFPGRTRAMIMDSPVDSDVWVNRPAEARREQLASFENSLQRFFRACAVAGDACGTWAGADPEDSFDRIVDRLNDHPLPAPGATLPVPVTGDELLDQVGLALYSKFAWAAAAQLIEQAHLGNGVGLRETLVSSSSRRPDGTWPASGEFFATTAQDWRTSRRVGDYLAEGRHAYGVSPHWWYIAHGYGDVAYAVKPHPSRDVFRGPFRHSPRATPMLVIGGTHDPATPYVWSQRYVEQLGNARLLTYRSDGHGAATDLNPCVFGTLVAYVVDLTLPEEGATCEQDFDPFPSAGARQAQATADLLAWKEQTLPAR